MLAASNSETKELWLMSLRLCEKKIDVLLVMSDTYLDIDCFNRLSSALNN